MHVLPSVTCRHRPENPALAVCAVCHWRHGLGKRRTCYVSNRCVLNFLFCTGEDSYLACLHFLHCFFYCKRVYFWGAKHVVPNNNLFGLRCELFTSFTRQKYTSLPTTAFCFHSSKKLQTSFFVQLWLLCMQICGQTFQWLTCTCLSCLFEWSSSSN